MRSGGSRGRTDDAAAQPVILYGNPLSTYCAKVRAVLRHKGLAFEDRTPPDGYGSAAYRAIVPMSTIPGFVDGELVLSESEAIVEYLQECHPRPAMLPDAPAARARIRALSRIHDCWVEPQLRALYAQASPSRRDASAVADHHGAFVRRLDGFAAQASPSPFLGGSMLTIADCAWPTTLLQAKRLFAAFGLALELPAHLVRWRDALAAHPAIAPGLGPCDDAMQAWLAKTGGDPHNDKD